MKKADRKDYFFSTLVSNIHVDSKGSERNTFFVLIFDE